MIAELDSGCRRELSKTGRSGSYEYGAYRQEERRAITRFEVRLSEGIAGLFIPDPIQGSEHKTAKEEALTVIAQLVNRTELARGLMQIGRVSRNFDQDNIPNNSGTPTKVKTQRSKLISGGSSIEFAADSPEKAYWEEPAVGNVRISVKGSSTARFFWGRRCLCTSGWLFRFEAAAPNSALC
jgi:hypothetical protein